MARYSTAGGQLQININGSFPNIDGVETFSGPTAEKQEIDDTALGDTAAQSLAGLPDYGQFSGTIFDNPSDPGNARLLASFNTNPAPIENFKYILPFSGPGNTFSWNGYVKTWQLSQEKNAAGKYSFSLRATGTVTRT